MNLPLNRSFQLSWLLPYNMNGIQDLTGINIRLQRSNDNKSLTNRLQKTNTISLLSNLLVTINQIFNFNLVSLEGGHKDGDEVQAKINIATSNAQDFMDSLKAQFSKYINNLLDAKDTLKIHLETSPASQYHIASGLSIFKLIRKLYKNTNPRRKKTKSKVMAVCDFISITTGETYHNMSDLELALECKSDNDLILERIEHQIKDFAKVNEIEVLDND